MSDSPKRGLLDSPSPTREQRARQAVAEATASASNVNKWKMQIGAPLPSGSGSRFKKKPEREDWKDEQQMLEKRMILGGKNGSFEEPVRKQATQPVPIPEKNLSIRKQMAMKEPPPKRLDSPKKPKLLPPIPPIKPLVNPSQVVLDKFGNFRLMTPPELKKAREGEAPPLPPGAPLKGTVAGKAQSRWWITRISIVI